MLTIDFEWHYLFCNELFGNRFEKCQFPKIDGQSKVINFPASSEHCEIVNYPFSFGHKLVFI